MQRLARERDARTIGYLRINCAHLLAAIHSLLLFTMELTLTTPALLFPAISLVLLAYTNRFLTLSALVRSLHSDYKKEPDPFTLVEIRSLRYRVRLAARYAVFRGEQFSAVYGLYVCSLCRSSAWFGNILFGLSLLLMIGSLAISVREIQISTHALDLHLRDLENQR